MNFGQISGNTKLNDRIYDCFEIISERTESSVVKKFVSEGESQIPHTFRELLVGAFLERSGFSTVYGQKIEAKTPDWCIVDDALYKAKRSFCHDYDACKHSFQ